MAKADSRAAGGSWGALRGLRRLPLGAAGPSHQSHLGSCAGYAAGGLVGHVAGDFCGRRRAAALRHVALWAQGRGGKHAAALCTPGDRRPAAAGWPTTGLVRTEIPAAQGWSHLVGLVALLPLHALAGRRRAVGSLLLLSRQAAALPCRRRRAAAEAGAAAVCESVPEGRAGGAAVD